MGRSQVFTISPKRNSLSKIPSARHGRSVGSSSGSRQGSTTKWRELLKYLHSGRASKLRLLIIVHEKYPTLDRWIEARGRAQSLPWQRFSRVPTVIEKLLPKSVESPVEPAPQTDVHQYPGVRVLFVDDSQSARYAYRSLLQSRGYPVTVAGSVTEAEEVAASADFDLIILDYYLPDGTGAELCRKLKAAPRSAAATMAVITGSYREQIIKSCLEAGAVECMFKNEAKELFITRVNSIARSIESQRSVEAERRRLNGILGSVGDGVYGVDESGKLSFINNTGASILGYEKTEQMIGQQAPALLHRISEGGGSDGVLEKAYASGESISGYETVFRHQTGRPLPVECTVFPLAIREHA